MFKKVYFVILASLLSLSCFADQKSQETMKRYDIGFYHPERFGLRELTYDVEIDGLTEKLNDQMIFGKMRKVYFKVGWMMDDLGTAQKRIIVVGMPKGFDDMKKALRQMVSSRLDYVVADTLAVSMKNCDGVYAKTKKGGKITCEDLSQEQSKTVLYFGNSGKMEKYESFAPGVRTEGTMIMSPKPWSNNKWLMDRLVTKQYSGMQNTTTEYTFEYDKVSSYGFPKTMNITTNLFIIRPVVTPDADQEQLIQSSETVMRFSNFEVNTGSAKAMMSVN